MNPELKYYRLFLDILNIVHNDQKLDFQIDYIFSTVGELINVSRVYIFEDDFKKGISKNTHEWCAEGIEPQIEELQAVPYAPISCWHEMLRERGAIIADDIKTLPEDIYEILKPQGILSIAVIPLYINETMFGYVGFDDCNRHRKWTDEELEALRALSNLVEILIVKHEAQARSAASYNILRTIFDNVETPIYAADADTNEIMFANRKFLEELKVDNINGKFCWQIVRNNQNGICSDCPRERLLEIGEGAVMSWEIYNERIKKWYCNTARLIKWIDGRMVHLQTSLDITSRKEYEKKLITSATYDNMTNVYNRKNGLEMFEKILRTGARDNFTITLCYIDIDKLKCVNDTFGHAEGDKLIISVANVIKSSLRDSDVLARMGGDEFVMILRSCTLKDAKKIVNGIYKKIEAINHSKLLPYDMSFSVGYEEILPAENHDSMAIIAEADKKMYMHKKSKRHNLI